MSWKIMNQILGLAAVDPDFWLELQQNPLEAADRRGFQLTPEERQAFCEVNTQNLVVFCQSLLDQLDSSENNAQGEQ